VPCVYSLFSRIERKRYGDSPTGLEPLTFLPHTTLSPKGEPIR